MSGNGFFTFSDYLRKKTERLSPSSEDYLEMIYRLSLTAGYTRVNDLAQALNVQPPSVTKMLHKLADLNLIKYEKYGVITLETAGKVLGETLLKRHNLIEEFLKLLGIKEDRLEQTEKIEHTVNEEVLNGITDLIYFFKINPEILNKFQQSR
jgi:Mn-dependent DtxR family transcriptional regulator